MPHPARAKHYFASHPDFLPCWCTTTEDGQSPSATSASEDSPVPSGPDFLLRQVIEANYLGHFSESIALCKHMLANANKPHPYRWRAWLELAVANMHVGNLAEAHVALAEANAAKHPTDALQQAYTARVMGQFEAHSNHYTIACEYLASAHDQFMLLGMQVDAAHCRQDMAGMALLHIDAQRALPALEEVRAIFAPRGRGLDLAWNNCYVAAAYQRLNRYEEALNLQQTCAQAFLDCGAPFFVAVSQAEIGILLCRLNRYAEAEEHLTLARTFFVEHGASSEAVRCDINLAWLYDLTNRLEKALPLVESAAKHSLESGRPVRAARCFQNLALIYQQLGQYDKSLHAFLRARDVFEDQEAMDDVAACDEYLAGTYLGLSMQVAAIRAFMSARNYYEQKHLDVNSARCETHLSELCMVQADWEQAQTLLEHARGLYEANSLTVQAAECDRLLAEVLVHQGKISDAELRITGAREVFERNHLVIQVALCNMLQGDLCLAKDDTSRAQNYFESARVIFEPAMLDKIWRAREGLGLCALKRNEKQTALTHFVQGVHAIQKVRAPLPTERLSAAYFSGRIKLFEAAFSLAVELEQYEEALKLSDAAKTTTFPLFLQNRGRRMPDAKKADARVTSLMVRETAGRRELAELHARLDLTTQLVESRQDTEGTDEAELVQRLNTLHQSQEDLMEQLRLAASAEWKLLTAAPLSLTELQKTMDQQLGTGWLCLAYHVEGMSIHIFAMRSGRLSCYRKTLSTHDQFVLRQCTSSSFSTCNLVYASMLGTSYLRRLFPLLIPEAVRESLQELDLLVIIPSGCLQRLPFQALLDENAYLVEQVPLVYAPSLQSLQMLISSTRAAPDNRGAFLCGLDEFLGRALPLHYAKAEIESLKTLFGKETQALWGEAATAGAIQQLSQRGDLLACRLIHFATHSVMDASSPLQSRILLHGGELTVADILDLHLESAQVTLSSCRGASGESGSGEELLNLARAFFYAGAQTVVASLWPVLDRETQCLMTPYYQYLLRGYSSARALQQIQVDLIHTGATPYQWAAFNVIGRP